MNESQSNQILTCIVDGMRSDRPPAIRGAAARALINSLDFTRSNFETQQERDVIMQVRRRTVAYNNLSAYNALLRPCDRGCRGSRGSVLIRAVDIAE